MHDIDASIETSAAALLARLSERGVDYIFANAGTDFAPIVEAVARQHRARFPRFVIVPHENLAMAMAHGYYRISGKPAAVMCHVTVGTANALCGLMNAARDNIPILLAAGRTPNTESGHAASRNGAIHWGTESFDQGGIVREYVKWDYELRAGQAVAAIVDRALDIAMSEPRGPVYLTLPREVLADPPIPKRRSELHDLGASPPQPARGAIEHAAQILANAEFPLIVTASAGRTHASFKALATLAFEHALPVVQPHPRDLSLATTHPMSLGFDAHAFVPRADAILDLDSVVPWIPSLCVPDPRAKVIHMASDPLASRYPFREFETDLLITGENAAAITALDEAMRAATRGKETQLKARHEAVAQIRTDQAERRKLAVEKARTVRPLSVNWVAHCVNELKSKDAIIVNELGIQPGFLDMSEWGSYMTTSIAGGLGFGLGAAAGAKLAAPDREVIVCCGEGSYMFGNPTPYHFVQQAENLPTLTIISNNHGWHAVRAATLSVYPQGAAAKANVMPLTRLEPSLDFEKAISVIGGYGEKVEEPGNLPDAIKRGLDAVRSGTPAILNVLTQGR
jgi:acetolactate synthase-1/2/3 large subunit